MNSDEHLPPSSLAQTTGHEGTAVETLAIIPDSPECKTSSTAGATVSKQGELRRRKDSGKIHRVEHGILSREILVALTQLGEEPKTYRRLERQFRTALKPAPPWGNLFFDRFWASYLRLMLVGRLEAKLVGSKSAENRSSGDLLSLVPGKQPTLILSDTEAQESQAESVLELPSDLLHQLVLAQRYDRHNAREMYRALALLLLLRRRGEAGLEDWATEMLGASSRSTPDHEQG